MRRFLPSGVAGGLLLVAALIALAGSAIAYFSSEGQGTASAAVSKLTTPTIGTATAAAGGTVTLNWSATTAPGEGTVNYYVTRDGGVPAGTCPSAAAPTAVLTCIDKEVPIGEHSYTVTAVWNNWTVTSGVKTANVTIGAATKFTLTASTGTPVAAGSTNLTITAKDQNNATVTTYAGSHSLVFSGAAASPSGTLPTVANSSGTAVSFGSATAITFTAGVATVSSTKNGVMKLYKAGAASIVATEGSITTPTPAAVTVSPAATSKFILAAASATPAVGAADNLTITAQDAYGNTATAYTGSKNLIFSGALASPGGTPPTVTDSSGADIAFGAATAVLFDAGVAIAAEGDGGAIKLYKSGATTVKATEGAIVTPTGVVVTVTPGTVTNLVLTAATATPVAATGFNLTITAQEAYGNTATAYAGSKSITFAGAAASPSGALPTVVNAAGTAINFGSVTALTFTAGVATAASSKNGYAKLNKAGATAITATDGTLTTPALALTVSPGAANRLALIELAVSAGTIGTPCLFTCTITALGNSGTVKAKVAVTDSVGNIVSNLAEKSVTVTVTTGGTITGSPLSTAATGPAQTTTEFTYTSPLSGSFTHTITAASTGYTGATATVTK